MVQDLSGEAEFVEEMSSEVMSFQCSKCNVGFHTRKELLTHFKTHAFVPSEIY
jgi:uncharacterized C2H2 Zn-finger protein